MHLSFLSSGSHPHYSSWPDFSSARNKDLNFDGYTAQEEKATPNHWDNTLLVCFHPQPLAPRPGGKHGFSSRNSSTVLKCWNVEFTLGAKFFSVLSFLFFLAFTWIVFNNQRLSISQSFILGISPFCWRLKLSAWPPKLLPILFCRRDWIIINLETSFHTKACFGQLLQRGRGHLCIV